MYRFLLSFLAIISFSYINASELSPAKSEPEPEEFFDAPQANVQLPAAEDVPYLSVGREYNIVQFQPGSYFSVIAFMVNRIPHSTDQLEAQNLFTYMCQYKNIRHRVGAEKKLFSKFIMPIEPQLIRVLNNEENEKNLLIPNQNFVESLENFLAKEKDEHEKAKAKKKADEEKRLASINKGHAVITALGMQKQRAFVSRDSSSGSDSEGESSSGGNMFRSATERRQEQAREKQDKRDQLLKKLDKLSAELDKLSAGTTPRRDPYGEVVEIQRTTDPTVVESIEDGARRVWFKVEDGLKNFFAGWR